MRIPFTNIEINRKTKSDNEVVKNEVVGLDWLLENQKENSNPFSESTYYTCMKILSESLAKLPLKAYERTAKGGKRRIDHEYLKVLAERPNSFSTATAFWCDVETRRNHYGNCYIYLDFKKKTLKDGKKKYTLDGMYILDNDNVEVVIDNKKVLSPERNKVFYKYRGDDKIYIFSSDEILHFRTSISTNGITGLSIKEQLYDLLSTSKEGEKYLKTLFENGMTGKAVLNYTSDLKSDAVEKMAKMIKTYVGRKENMYNIIPLNPSMELKPLNINLNDAQFLENKKFLSNQIASLFGIKPYFLNDYSGKNDIEFQNTSFYIDTLMYILKHYEEELNYKLMDIENASFKFNEKAILRLNAKEQMEVLKDGVNNAIYLPNEAREILDLDSVDGGDTLICNGNYIPITEVGNQYKSTKEIERGGTKQVEDTKQDVNNRE